MSPMLSNTWWLQILGTLLGQSRILQHKIFASSWAKIIAAHDQTSTNTELIPTSGTLLQFIKSKNTHETVHRETGTMTYNFQTAFRPFSPRHISPSISPCPVSGIVRHTRLLHFNLCRRQAPSVIYGGKSKTEYAYVICSANTLGGSVILRTTWFHWALLPASPYWNFTYSVYLRCIAI